MAGLLDGGNWFTGDDTVKDQFGQTQADRREPLWGGLIQGGMSLLAAGQDLTPQARAQYMSQAGQAYGGIPAAMRAQTSAAAQQILQGQQIKAGQAKLAAADRLAALAKTPEFQAAVAKLEPEERMLLQASLDAGDMGHAQEILTGAARTRATQAEVLRKEKRDDAKAAADAAKAGGVNTFGKDPAAVAWNNLQHYPPNTPQYAAAYEFLTREQKDAAGNTISPKIDLGKYGYKEPEHRAPGADPVPPTADGTVTPPVVAPAVVPPAVVPPAVTPPAPPPAVVPPDSLPPFVVPGGAVPPAPPPVVPSAGPAVPPPAPPVPPPVVAPTPPVPPPVPPAEAQAQADPVKFGWTLPKSQSFTRSDGVTVSRDTQGGVLVETPDAGAKYYEKEGRAPKIYPRVAVPEKQAGVLKGATYGLDSVDILEKELANNKVLLGPEGRLVKGLGDLVGAGNLALNARNPEGNRARQIIAAIASGKIKEMSGAAVSQQEFTRLDKFLPQEGDTEEQIKKKLIDIKRELQIIGSSEFRTLPPGTMYNPDEKRRFGGKSSAVPAATSDGAKPAASTPAPEPTLLERIAAEKARRREKGAQQ